MDSGKRPLAGIAAALGMLALILDARTAAAGAAEGIRLCIQVVIPSLFPFFVLSSLLTGSLTGRPLSVLRPVGRLCGIPEGAEGLLLAGALGGYPVGAQGIAQAYGAGALHREDARRMLGFCCNAGPAFLFGMGASLFDRPELPVILWAIHLLSAVLVGMVLPGKSQGRTSPPSAKAPTLAQAVPQSIMAMAGVCGWVVLTRVMLAFLDRWCLWLLPPLGKTLVYGLLEITNGFAALPQTTPEGLRFVLCSVFLALGGICVAMQTGSVTARQGLSTGAYLPGKLLQAAFSLCLAGMAQYFLFAPAQRLPFPVWLPVFPLFAAGILPRRKKSSSIPRPIGV